MTWGLEAQLLGPQILTSGPGGSAISMSQHLMGFLNLESGKGAGEESNSRVNTIQLLNDELGPLEN